MELERQRPADPQGRHAQDPARASSSRATSSSTSSRARPAAPTSTRRHDPGTQTAAPVQIDQVLGSLQTDTRKGLQKLLVGYGDALNGAAAAGRGRRPGAAGAGQDRRPGAEQVARLLAAGAARHGAREPGLARASTCTTSRSSLPASRRCSPRSTRNEGIAQGPHHELQHARWRRSPPSSDNLRQTVAPAAGRATKANPTLRQPQRGVPRHARVGARDDPRASARRRPTIEASFPWVSQTPQLVLAGGAAGAREGPPAHHRRPRRRSPTSRSDLLPRSTCSTAASST